MLSLRRIPQHFCRLRDTVRHQLTITNFSLGANQDKPWIIMPGHLTDFRTNEIHVHTSSNGESLSMIYFFKGETRDSEASRTFHAFYAILYAVSCSGDQSSWELRTVVILTIIHCFNWTPAQILTHRSLNDALSAYDVNSLSPIIIPLFPNYRQTAITDSTTLREHN